VSAATKTLVRGLGERAAGALFPAWGNRYLLGQTAVASWAGESRLSGGRGQSSRGRCHVRTLTSPKTFDCEICSAVLKSQRDLDNHRCLLHDECGAARLGAPITFRCATCGEAFARRGDLLAHLRQRGHPTERDKVRPLGAQRPRGRPRHRNG